MTVADHGGMIEREALYAEIDRLRGQLAEYGATETPFELQYDGALRGKTAQTVLVMDHHAFLKSLIDANQDCIKVLDLDGHVVITEVGAVRPVRIGDPGDNAGAWWPGPWPEPGRASAIRAIELARSGGAGRFVAAYPSQTGPPKWWDVHVTAIRERPDGQDKHDEPTHLLAISRDVTEEQARLELIAEREALHRAILDSAIDYAIISLDREGRITSWSQGAQRILQWDPTEMLGRSADMLFSPEDVVRGRLRHEMVEALETGASKDERWRSRKDGSRFWANSLMMPLKTDQGRQIGFIQVLRDRTDRKHAEEHQQLLMQELNHRVKNTLSVVQAVVNQTLRAALSPEDARQAIMQRLGVIGRAQDLLTLSSWTAAPVEEVISAATAPMAQSSHRLHAQGPTIELGPRTVLSLTMALHELGTNAYKYGAFSNDQGRVDISWIVEPSAEGPLFRLVWREFGGPAVQPPTHKGFGSRLIEFGLARGLGGKVELSFDPGGVCWSVSAPLSAVQGA